MKMGGSHNNDTITQLSSTPSTLIAHDRTAYYRLFWMLGGCGVIATVAVSVSGAHKAGGKGRLTCPSLARLFGQWRADQTFNMQII